MGEQSPIYCASDYYKNPYKMLIFGSTKAFVYSSNLVTQTILKSVITPKNAYIKAKKGHHGEIRMSSFYYKFCQFWHFFLTIITKIITNWVDSW